MVEERALPETPAELFDLLQQLFGFGDYDEQVNPEPPWFKVRMTEIGKLKRFMKSRNLSARTLGITAWYCHDHQIRVDSFGYLARHVREALVEHRKQADQAKREEAADRLQEALERSTLIGRPDWTERLLRTPPALLSRTLDEFDEETK